MTSYSIMEIASQYMGNSLYRLVQELFPISRSLTGKGVRDTLSIIGSIIPELKVHEVQSGTRCFDWEVPLEWNINDAFIISPDGQKIVDFKKNNLHVVGYSEPIDSVLTLEELLPHLHSLPELPTAVPYLTSYYQRRWGFCLTEELRSSLKSGRYHVKIDSTLESGSMTYGEIFFPGELQDEVLFSTNICHPSMANNELSGPAIQTYLAKWISNQSRRLSYRFLFLPETIGSIFYISRNLDSLRSKVKAGFVLSCLGDRGCFSAVLSPDENSLSDRMVRHAFKQLNVENKLYSFVDRGSDERQFCSPGVDLPMTAVCRTKFCEFPEYHTSLDDLNFISEQCLSESFELFQKIVFSLEHNFSPKAKFPCEPQLGRRGLYHTSSPKRGVLTQSSHDFRDLMAYSNGNRDLIEIADTIGRPCWELVSAVEKLVKADLLTV